MAQQNDTADLRLVKALRQHVTVAKHGERAVAQRTEGTASRIVFGLTVNVLGDPDNGAIFTAYLGSLLMAGGFLAIGSAVSAATKSQVIAFVISVVLCFAMLLLGFGAVQEFFGGWVPEPVLDVLSTFSFLTQFDMLSRGVIEARSVVFFASLIACLLVANVIIVDLRKSA